MTTLGCRLNEAELVSWGHAFERAGHKIARSAADANLIVINTCAVTAEASRKSRKFVGNLHRKNPSAQLVVTGCMAELEPEKAASLIGVDLVVGNKAKDQLVDEVLTKLDIGTMPARAIELEGQHPYSEEEDAPALPDSGLVQLGSRSPSARRHTRAFVKVQDGCRNKCSYCVVTIARGEERSRSIDELVAEINQLAERGYREAVLTGVHLGGYGHDLGHDLPELVRAVLARTSIERVRLSSLEPWDLPDDFGELWQDPRLMPHLHLPLQSGSDSVLRRMSRRCFRKDYRALLERLRRDVPALNVTTDLIVGFPGETDEEFEESLDFCKEIAFGHMHIFGFSPREGTRAAAMGGRIPGPLIRERSRRMHRLAARMKEDALRSYLDSHAEVLWEGRPAPTDDGGLVYRGYTENYHRVETSVEPGEDLQGAIDRVHLTGLAGTPADGFVATRTSR
jgi:threonylcarbamoyladenosine tRNA methylthiotransferase MtaB